MLWLLLLIPFNQDQLDNYIEQDRPVLVKMEPVPQLDRLFVRMVLNRFNVVVMEKYEDNDCFIIIYHKKATVKFYKGRK